MIVYDLKCSAGHTFEGWFKDAQAFERQRNKGLLSCPLCGVTEVSRALSTFGLSRHRDREDKPARPRPHPLKVFSDFVRKNFENVGADFTREALKMHYGVTDRRNIRGVSTSQEEETLREEGVKFFKVPLLSDPASEDE